MVQVEFNTGLKATIPNRFDELNRVQLLTYVQVIEMRKDILFSQVDGKLITRNADKLLQAEIILLRSLLPISVKAFEQITPEQIRDLLATEKLCQFYFEDLLSINRLPFFRWRLQKYYGPVSEFHRLSFEEFGFADDAFLSFNETKDEEQLNKLVAILYRRRIRGFSQKHFKSNGDIREPFNHITYDYRIRIAEQLPLNKRMLVYLWFSHCRFAMLEHYKAVFSRKEEDEGEGRSSWLNTAMNIGGGVLNFHTIRKENVYMVFEEMLRLVNEAERLKEQFEKQKHGSS